MNNYTDRNLMNADKKAICEMGHGINVCVPLGLIIYLSHDGNYKNPSRLTKIEAFEYLLMLHMNALKENGTNIAQLAEKLCWSRASVQKFISILKKLNVLEVVETKNGKMVCLKESVFVIASSPQEQCCKNRQYDSPFQPPLQHISSRETKEDFSKRK